MDYKKMWGLLEYEIQDSIDKGRTRLTYTAFQAKMKRIKNFHNLEVSELEGNMPEQIIYRKLSPQKVTCPNRPDPNKYRVNLLVPLDECKKCELHRGHDDNHIACAWSKASE